MVSLRLLLFSCFVVRQVLLASSGNCPPSINCGHLGQISFPFTTPQHPKCGMLIIHGCEDHEPDSPKSIQNNQRWFNILKIKPFTITIRDDQLHDLLLKQSCDILNFNSMFTVRMPLVSSRLQNHLTVFGCNINYTMDLQLYYSVSNSTSICRNQNNTVNGVSDLNNTAIVVLPDSIPSNSSLLNRCKKVELPTPSKIDFTHFDLDDLFYFLTADIVIELQVSQKCSTCHDIDGGQCRLDNKGQFYCHHGISIKTRLIVAAVASSMGLVGVLTWFLRRHFISNKNPPYQIIELFLKNHGHLSAKRYTYTEIKKATNSFKNKLGQGGYGSVYKGKLQDGSLVAVKVLSESNGNGEEFISEVASISVTSHVNIVSLLGFYFGLAKVCARKESIISLLGARGTAGYIAPEVFSRNFGCVSHKSDVYSYGMMVLEMVGGKQNNNIVDVEHSSEIYFPHWIYKRLEQNQEPKLQSINNEFDKQIVKKIIIVSLWCIQTDPSQRPAMSKVVDMLEDSLECLKIPPKPCLSSPPRSPSRSSEYNTHTSQDFYTSGI